MGKFLIQSIRFLAILILTLFLFGKVLDPFFKRGIYHKSQWIHNMQSETLDCIIIGNSRASQIELDNQTLKYKNLAEDGTGLKMAYIQLHSFFKQKNQSKLILLQGDVLSLSKVDSEKKRSPRWLPYFDDEIIRSELGNEHDIFMVHKYLPFFGYFIFKHDWGLAAFFNQLIYPDRTPWGQHGFNYSCAKYINNGPTYNINSRDLSPNDVYLKKITDLAQRHNSDLIIFTAPYLTTNDPFEVSSDLDSKLSNYNIKYLDFSQVFQSDTALFRDNNHLNCTGVHKFKGIFSPMIESFVYSQEKSTDPSLSNAGLYVPSAWPRH